MGGFVLNLEVFVEVILSEVVKDFYGIISGEKFEDVIVSVVFVLFL